LFLSNSAETGSAGAEQFQGMLRAQAQSNGIWMIVIGLPVLTNNDKFVILFVCLFFCAYEFCLHLCLSFKILQCPRGGIVILNKKFRLGAPGLLFFKFYQNFDLKAVEVLNMP